MKLFVFERIDKLTANWHPEGGLVAIAEDIDHLLAMVSEDKYIQISDYELSKAEVIKMPDTATPKYWVFQDAGCC